jgi:hypothetical protein
MLAEYLRFNSLDATEQAKIDALWGAELEKIQAIEQGNVTPISGEQVLRELRSPNR